MAALSSAVLSLPINFSCASQKVPLPQKLPCDLADTVMSLLSAGQNHKFSSDRKRRHRERERGSGVAVASISLRTAEGSEELREL